MHRQPPWSEEAQLERLKQDAIRKAMIQSERVYAEAIKESTKAMVAREEAKMRMRTPEGDCPCEGCALLRTKMGTGLLTYLREFINEISQAVTKGKADPKTDIQLTFDGPDWSVIAGMTGRSKRYATVATTVGEIADLASANVLLQKPDLEPLREAYADDPVIHALLDWIEKRTA